MLAVLMAGGCTTRSLTITSDPEDAAVLLDNRWVANTPIRLSFRHGGMHEIILFKLGHEPRLMHYDSERLLFDQLPFDLFTDLGPWQAQDHRSVHVTLEPSRAAAEYERDEAATRAALEARAELLRKRARAAQLAAPPAAPLLPTRPAGKIPLKSP